jgi:NAD(P)-dependent dehydrogenase (short-subunit alcohol dehydrogenase family)
MSIQTGRLTDRVAVITGAGRGIGAAIAKRYAAEGAKVVIADLDKEVAEGAAQAIVESGGEAISVAGNVGISADVDAIFDAAMIQYSTVDILVNNAAESRILTHFLDSDEQWWDHYLTTNLKSQYLCMRRAAPIMARQRRGSIINLSSGGATRSHRGMVAYDASKGGIEALTRSTALELAPYGIRVNALVPGLIATNPQEAAESLRRRDATVPIGRGGTPDDLAGPAVFLASDDAEYVTGARLVVDGGVLVQQRSPQIEVFPVDQFPVLS